METARVQEGKDGLKRANLAIELDKSSSFKVASSFCMLGVTILNRIRNDELRRRLGVEKPILQFIKCKRLKSFGNVVRRNRSGYVNQAYVQGFSKKRSRGRRKKRWCDQIRSDLDDQPINIAEGVARDGGAWKRLTDGNNGARILRGLCR